MTLSWRPRVALLVYDTTFLLVLMRIEQLYLAVLAARGVGGVGELARWSWLQDRHR
jgi:hypothetical protein